MPRAYTIIVNPSAGRGRARRLLPRLEAVLEKGSLDVDLRLSASPAEPPALAREAMARGRAVVACGGDGLVGELAAVVAEGDGVMGIIPAGAGNDFARHLGLDPRRPLEALAVLELGLEGEVDMGRVNGRLFCCVAGTGFDAEANRWANTVERLSGTPLYVAAVLRTLASYRPQPFRIAADGAVRQVEAWLVAVANAPSYGGGMLVAPTARVDDGMLDVAVIGALPRSQFLRTFPKVFKGTHVEHPAVEVFSARRVEIASDGGELALEVYADGERVGPLPVEIEAVPRALRLIVPRGAPVYAAPPGAGR